MILPSANADPYQDASIFHCQRQPQESCANVAF